MKNLKHYFTLTFVVLLILGLSMPALTQGEKAETLVGHWTFERGEELKDHTGNWDDIELRGATVAKGQLKLDNNKWALAVGYKGPMMEEKTLVAWLYLDGLDVMSGGPLAIDRVSIDHFDAIVYGERQPRRWMAGSSFFRRTQDPVPGFEEEKTGELIQMAISYEDEERNPHIQIYRNGALIGDYTQGPIATWEKGDAEALFGVRAFIGGTPYGYIDARVEDARIYGAVLSQDEIKKLRPDTLQVEARGKLTTLWGAMKTK